MDDSEIFDPYDMNREEFNSDLCLLRYTQECNLENLISRKVHIDKEICSLNNDIQNMLYDNYIKFINSASVVSKLKGNFQKMEENMDLLHSKMASIEHTSSSILENFRPTEGIISQLIKNQDTMKRLVVLTDLVPNLREQVDFGFYTAAARRFLKAEKILKKYQHLPSFDGIVTDCFGIMEKVKLALKDRLSVEIYEKEELCETLNLILRLGEPTSSLLDIFIKQCNSYLMCDLNEMDGFCESTREKSDSKDLPKCIIDACINLGCTYMTKIENIMEIIKEAFLFSNDTKVFSTASKTLDEFVTNSFGHLTMKLRQNCKELFKDVDDDFLSHVLDKLSRQCYRCATIIPQLNIFERSLDIILQICTDRCEFHLLNLKESFQKSMIKLRNASFSNAQMSELCTSLIEATEHKLTETLLAVVCYIRPEFRCCREIIFRKLFCNVLVREGIFISYFRYIKDEIWQLVSSLTPRQGFISEICLVLAKYLSALHNTVFQFLAKVDSHLCLTTENLLLRPPEDISYECHNTAERIIKYYMDVCCENMTCMIHRSMDNKNWMKMKEPTRPRAVIKMVLDYVLKIKMETEFVFGPYNDAIKHKVTDLGRALIFKSRSISELSDGNSVETRVLQSKLFNECPKLTNKVELNTCSIINYIIKKTLKSFVECVRLSTFSHFGFQQIQVDISYLELHFADIFVLNDEIGSLFDTILSSALDRTHKAEFMNCQVISAICRNII